MLDEVVKFGFTILLTNVVVADVLLYVSCITVAFGPADKDAIFADGTKNH